MAKRIQRQAPHRPEREEQHTRAFREIRGENHSLRKQVKRLRKQVAQLDAHAPDPEAAVEGPKTPSKDACQKCGSPDLLRVSLPIGVIQGCRGCGDRVKVA